MNNGYKIRLSNGKIIDHLIKKPDCYISYEYIDASIFNGNCSPVTFIDDNGSEDVHENMELLYIQKVDRSLIRNDEYYDPKNQYEYRFVLEDLYSVELSDGTILKNLKLNGNNFISKEYIDASVFTDNCSQVKIICNGKEDIHKNMELVQVIEQLPGEWWFILRDLTKEELYRMKTQSDIEYIAMMSSIEL